jgi:hypothetical protein
MKEKEKELFFFGDKRKQESIKSKRGKKETEETGK